MSKTHTLSFFSNHIFFLSDKNFCKVFPTSLSREGQIFNKLQMYFKYPVGIGKSHLQIKKLSNWQRVDFRK
jgi:hypothetical protein